MNNLSKFLRKGDYSWPANRTRFQDVGFVKRAMLLEPFWMKPIFLILNVLGERGPVFQYPEWLIMFIAILSVKLKIKSYVQIHRMAVNIGTQSLQT